MNLFQRTHAGLRARSRQTRRGTFIVLVVGMLALMAIIAVVYFSIGQADARSSAALVSANSRDDVPNAVRDYIKMIIADDVTAFVDPGAAAVDRTQRYVREAWDYPYTSPLARSIDPIAANRFNPVGTRGDDPWLRSSEPTIIGTGATWGDEPLENAYKSRRDWLNFSNIAPDGNYVNLYNLRPSSAGGPSGGGFDATVLNMRRSLSLFDQNGVPGATTLDDGRPVVALIPAHFSYRQRNAFRPLYDDLPYNDANYVPYSYADADGDGFVDSRWQELVNASNPAVDPTYVVRPNDGLRYFIAASIIDLSARINVNTATDMVNAPTADSPAGVTPADFDLRGMLAMQDPFEIYAGAYGDPLGDSASGDYNIWNPTDPESVENYALQTNAIAYDVGVGGYNALRLGIETSVIPPPRSDLTAFAKKYLGDAAEGDRTMLGGLDREKSYLSAGAGSAGATLTSTGLVLSGGYGLSDLTELLTFRVANDPDQLSILESAVGGRFPESGADAARTRRYSALRDNRTLAFERPGATLLAPDADKLDAAMLLFATDARQRLTTISGDRPIRPAPTNAAILQTNATDSRYDFSTSVRSLIFNRDAARLFRGYADALSPFSGIGNVWNRAAGDFNQTRFLAYGYDGPELGMRMAAHSAVNLLAATRFDGIAGTEDFEPYPYTLILNEGARSNLNTETGTDVGSRTYKQAWWEVDTRRLDLTSARIAPSTVAMPTNAVTMYGVKPQPVITQATAFTVYVDAPATLGGDVDVGSLGTGAPPVIELVPITINGDTTWGANSDYLGRVLAIQLTNPYDDIDIPLSRDDLTTEGTTISSTEVLFTYYIEFGGKTYKLAEFDPDDASGLKSLVLRRDECRNFVILDASYATFNARWNAVYAKYASGPIDPSASPFRKWLNAQFSVENDPSTIDPAIIVAVNVRTGAIEPAGEIFSGTTDQQRSIRLWRAMISNASDDNMVASSGMNNPDNDYLVDRMRDPAGSGATLKRELPAGNQDISGTFGLDETYTGTPSSTNNNTGFTISLRASVRRPDESSVGDTGVPAYMIEAKSSSRNRTATDPFSPSSVDREDFEQNTNGAYARFSLFIDGTANATPPTDVLMTTAREHADEKTGGAIGNNRTGVAYSALIPEFPRSLRARATSGTLRPADLLLPFAIGPFVEMDATGASQISDFSPAVDRFYTLGEALALALDYDGGPAGAPIADLGSPNRNPGGVLAAPRPAITRANLVFDDYVLFRDVDLNGQFTYAAGAVTDALYGTGIPAALSILDIFHTMNTSIRSERVSTPGKVNINTAPTEVVRAARMLSPFDAVPTDWSWFTPAGQHDGNSDIASTLIAYRDKIPLHPRRAAGFNAAAILDFSDLNDAADDLNQDGDNNGRFFATDVPGLRETPGFRSIGEIMLARDIRASNPEGLLHSIDRLGYDSQDTTAPGVDAATGNTSTDDIADDYSERLAIGNSVANLFSVRSDYYAVWFVLHGYAQTDVASLKPTDPLVPTVARRFLMVVDRSNVNVKGDEPQVVLFKELPY